MPAIFFIKYSTLSKICKMGVLRNVAIKDICRFSSCLQ